MPTIRRTAILFGVLVIFVLGYSAWRVWQVERELAAAEESANELLAAIDSGDAERGERALEGLQKHAGAAQEATSGAWWRGFTHLPLVGDDASGIAALSRSLDFVATGAEPVASALDSVDAIVQEGTIDLQVVEGMQQPISEASRSFSHALDQVSGVDSSGFAGTLKTRFDDYVRRVDSAAQSLSIAHQTVNVLPAMAGSEQPRTYLFVFQNNAEIRATGGLPGSWTQVSATNGRIKIERQGAGSDFPVLENPPIGLSEEERTVYGDALGQYFLGANFTPDFPRAAQLWRAHFQQRYPKTSLDGVLSLDPVSVGYLLEGTGPIEVDGVQITNENATEALLSDPYKSLSARQQDYFFRKVAQALFRVVTTKSQSPSVLLEAISRAAQEGRFRVAPFDSEVLRNLKGAKILGGLGAGEPGTPRVDVALNDATGSKMSYYLRYGTAVRATQCNAGTQSLEGRVTLSQSIRPIDARKLPDSVTGGGVFGTAPGEQTVFLQIYGPEGSRMSDLRIDGRLETDQSFSFIENRPVYVLAMSVRAVDETAVTWTMHDVEARSGGVVEVTPGVLPGSESSSFVSACN